MHAMRQSLARLLSGAMEKRRALWYRNSPGRISLQREWHGCSSADDLFNFARSHIGIGQNKEEYLRFLAYLEGEKPVNVLEIGVREGGTSFMFANALKTCRRVVGIDIRLRNIHLLKDFCPDWIVTQEFVCGESTSPRTLSRVKKSLGSAKLDVLFIDGDHSYAGVAADFKEYRQFVRDGGSIVFHDICMDHRRRYGVETTNDSGEVYLFWQEVRERYEIKEFFSDEKQNGAGIGLLVWDTSRSVD